MTLAFCSVHLGSHRGGLTEDEPHRSPDLRLRQAGMEPLDECIHRREDDYASYRERAEEKGHAI